MGSSNARLYNVARRGAIKSVVFELQQVGQIEMASKFVVFLVYLFPACMAVVRSQSQSQTTVSFIVQQCVK